MNSFIEYLLQSASILGIFYLGYHFFLRNEFLFRQNRIYLLFGIIAAVVIPAFQISVPLKQNTLNTIMLDEIVANSQGLVNTVADELSSSDILLTIYLIGVFIFSVRLISQVLQILILIKRNGIIRNGNDYIVSLRGDVTPFSVLNLIFINREKLNEQAFENILDHERVHIRQGHSFDLLLAELLMIFQWFNPIIWFFKKAIRTNHEYLADQGVLKKGYNLSSYQNLLLNQVFGKQINFLSNNFNQSLIKRRLTMMSNIKHSNSAVWKYIFLIPVTLTIAIFAIVSISIPTLAQDAEANVQMQESQQEQKEDVPIFTVVEDMPSFKGGKEAMMQYLSSNIKYPEEARKNGIEGTCFVTYVVEKDGSITNVKVLRGIGGGCDEEAMRVIENMPNWNPGKQKGKSVRVQFTIPIKFNLDSKKSGEEKKE